MKKLVVLTGAGASADSGIQTFRDVDGLWMGHKVTDVAYKEGWLRNKQLVLDFYNKRRRELDEVEPNASHIGLAELEKHFDVTIITQNVDDLHERAGSTKVIHLHGELKKMCSSRDKELTLPYEKNIEIGDKHEDGSQLRPFIVWFGERVPLYDKACKVVRDCDLFVVIGTSLQVFPAVDLINHTKPNIPMFLLDKKKPEDVDLTEFNFIQKAAAEGILDLIRALSPHI